MRNFLVVLASLLLLSGCAAKYDYVVTTQQAKQAQKAGFLPEVEDYEQGRGFIKKRDSSRLPHGKSFCFINDNPEPIPTIFADVSAPAVGWFTGPVGASFTRGFFNFMQKAADGHAACEMWDAQALVGNLVFSIGDGFGPFTNTVMADSPQEAAYWAGRGAISWFVPYAGYGFMALDKIKERNEAAQQRNQAGQQQVAHRQVSLPPQGRQAPPRKKTKRALQHPVWNDFDKPTADKVLKPWPPGKFAENLFPGVPPVPSVKF